MERSNLLYRKKSRRISVWHVSHTLSAVLLIEAKTVQSPTHFRWCSYRNCRWILIQTKRKRGTIQLERWLPPPDTQFFVARGSSQVVTHSVNGVLATMLCALQRSSFFIKNYDINTSRWSIYGQGRTVSLHFIGESLPFRFRCRCWLGAAFSFLAGPKV